MNKRLILTIFYFVFFWTLFYTANKFNLVRAACLEYNCTFVNFVYYSFLIFLALDFFFNLYRLLEKFEIFQ